jgi:hypothetical protein
VQEKDRAAATPSRRDTGGDTQPAQGAPAGKPTEVILYGYSEAYQYAAVEFYERVSGGVIYEDYDRSPAHPKYDQSISRNTSSRPKNIPSEALRLVNKYHGGDHWIKVTFNSAEAAERAIYTSPHTLHGFLVHAAPYRGAGPPDGDKQVLATEEAIRSATASPAAGSSTIVGGTSTTATSATATGLAPITSPTPRRRNLAAFDSITSPTSLGSSATATQAPSEPAPLKLKGAKRAILRPASEALLPATSRWRRTFGGWPIVSFFLGSGGASMMDEVPKREDGTFDWEKADYYWWFFGVIDFYFGSDFCGLKADDE